MARLQHEEQAGELPPLAPEERAALDAKHNKRLADTNRKTLALILKDIMSHRVSCQTFT